MRPIPYTVCQKWENVIKNWHYGMYLLRLLIKIIWGTENCSGLTQFWRFGGFLCHHYRKFYALSFVLILFLFLLQLSWKLRILLTILSVLIIIVFVKWSICNRPLPVRPTTSLRIWSGAVVCSYLDHCSNGTIFRNDFSTYSGLLNEEAVWFGLFLACVVRYRNSMLRIRRRIFE